MAWRALFSMRQASPAVRLAIRLAPICLALAAPALAGSAPNLQNDPAFEQYRALEQQGLGALDSMFGSPAATGAPGQPAAAATPSAAAAAPRLPVLAIVEFDSDTASTAELRAMSAAFHTELSKYTQFALLPLETTRARLEAAGFLPHDPYSPPPARSALANAAGATYLIMGTLNRVGEAFTLQTQLYSVRVDSVLKTDARFAEGGLPAILAQAGDSVTLLLGAVPPEPAAARAPATGGAAPGFAPAGAAAPAAKMPALEPISMTAGAPDSPLTAARQEIAALRRQIKSLQTELDKQTALARQYKADNDRLRAELSAAVEKARAPEPPASIRSGSGGAVSAPASAASFPPALALDDSIVGPPDAEKAKTLASEAMAEGLDIGKKIANLQEAVRLDPGVADYHLELAKALFKNRDLDKAMAACDAGIAKHPDNASLRIVKGAIYLDREDYVNAEKTYRTALSIDPNDAFALFNLALTVQNSEGGARKEEALAAWDNYFKIADADPMQRESGWHDEAVKYRAALNAQASPAAAPAASHGEDGAGGL